MALLTSGFDGDFNLAEVTLDSSGGKFIIFTVQIDFGGGPFTLEDSYGNEWELLQELVLSERTNVYGCLNPIVGPDHLFSVHGTTFRRPAINIMVFDDTVSLPFDKDFTVTGVLSHIVPIGDTSTSPAGTLSISVAGFGATGPAGVTITCDAADGYATPCQQPNGPFLGPTTKSGLNSAYRYATAGQENNTTWTASDPAIIGYNVILLTFSICPTLTALTPPVLSCGSDVEQLVYLNVADLPPEFTIQLTDPSGNVTEPAIVYFNDTVVAFLAVIDDCGTWTLSVIDDTGLCTSDPAPFLTFTATAVQNSPWQLYRFDLKQNPQQRA